LSHSGSFFFRSSHMWFTSTTVAHIPLPACAGIFASCSAWPTLLVLRVLHFPILANIHTLDFRVALVCSSPGPSFPILARVHFFPTTRQCFRLPGCAGCRAGCNVLLSPGPLQQSSHACLFFVATGPDFHFRVAIEYLTSCCVWPLFFVLRVVRTGTFFSAHFRLPGCTGLQYLTSCGNLHRWMRRLP
jgi:hypothetical protein